jgi:hypothetical protein
MNDSTPFKEFAKLAIIKLLWILSLNDFRKPLRIEHLQACMKEAMRLDLVVGQQLKHFVFEEGAMICGIWLLV